jgi:Tol biopolymer transport system component
VAIWAITPTGDRIVQVSRTGGLNPSWSPDSRWIAYQAKSPDGNWDLYLSEVERGRIIRLTAGPEPDLDPVWSPDGRRIAFRALFRDGADICTIPADGGTPARITRNAGADAPPAWSPDGKRIAFISYAAWTSIAVTPADSGSGRGATLFRGLMEPLSLIWHPAGDRLLVCAKSADLWTVPAGGGAAERLTNDIFEDRKPDVSPDGKRIVFESNRDGNPGLWTLDTAGEPRLLLAHPADADAHPRFSPDGKRIVFASNREEKTRQTDLWTVSPDGSNLRRLTSVEGLKGRPTWFSDNTRIIFESNRNGGWGLWALEPDGRVAPLPRPTPSMRPAWSPDGWWLAYQSQRGGNQDLYLTQMKTGQERRLTTDPAREGDPAWSRDSRRIAFVSDRAGTDDIWTMPASGEGPETALTSGPEDDIEPAWFPDGSRIAFVRIAPRSIWSITVP